MKITESSNRKILEPCNLENSNYQVDPYIGCEHYCYYCYALGNAETDWTEEVIIHKDVTRYLKKELENITPQRIYMGYHTDPYQPCEEYSCQTKKILQLFQELGFSSSILTKSDLVLRDIELFKEMDGFSISFSFAFLNEDIRKKFEHNTKETRKRFEALKILHEEGIKTNALVCPVIPYLTNPKEIVEMIAPYTQTIWVYNLSILNQSDIYWINVKNILKKEFSDKEKKIEEIIFNQDHEYWNQLKKDLEEIKDKKKLDLRIHL